MGCIATQAPAVRPGDRVIYRLAKSVKGRPPQPDPATVLAVLGPDRVRIRLDRRGPREESIVWLVRRVCLHPLVEAS